MKTVFHKYLEVYFSNRDLKATARLFSPDATGYGTGFDESRYDPQSLIDLYKRDLNEVPLPVAYEIIRLNIHSPAADVGITSAELNIELQISNFLSQKDKDYLRTTA